MFSVALVLVSNTAISSLLHTFWQEINLDALLMDFAKLYWNLWFLTVGELSFLLRTVSLKASETQVLLDRVTYMKVGQQEVTKK